VSGLAVPARYDGADATLAEVAVAVEETGRVLLPLPVLSTALAGAVLGPCVAAAEFLPGIADGSLRAAFVFTGTVTAAGDHVSGIAEHVLDGAEADLLVVRAGSRLYVVRARDAVVTPVGTLDQTRSQATVSFAGSPAVTVEADASTAEELLRVLLAVESAGAAAHCLDVTVAYLKTREQFGRPLGSFQALRHRCADLAVLTTSARATAYAAVDAAVARTADLPVLAPLAKRYCADAFWQVAAEMIQLHGGIGFTWEHQAHRYLKRAKTTQLLHGSPAELRRLVASLANLSLRACFRGGSAQCARAGTDYLPTPSPSCVRLRSAAVFISGTPRGRPSPTPRSLAACLPAGVLHMWVVSPRLAHGRERGETIPAPAWPDERTYWKSAGTTGPPSGRKDNDHSARSAGSAAGHPERNPADVPSAPPDRE
jgi:alkylation response protein AidB-like acyl-CoA dehydrogenase